MDFYSSIQYNEVETQLRVLENQKIYEAIDSDRSALLLSWFCLLHLHVCKRDSAIKSKSRRIFLNFSLENRQLSVCNPKSAGLAELDYLSTYFNGLHDNYQVQKLPGYNIRHQQAGLPL